MRLRSTLPARSLLFSLLLPKSPPLALSPVSLLHRFVGGAFFFWWVESTEEEEEEEEEERVLLLKSTLIVTVTFLRGIRRQHHHERLGPLPALDRGTEASENRAVWRAVAG